MNSVIEFKLKISAKVKTFLNNLQNNTLNSSIFYLFYFLFKILTLTLFILLNPQITDHCGMNIHSSVKYLF